MSDDIARLQAENAAMRELLEAAEDQIHGEWGAGTREPYDWLPEMEQIICRDSPGGHTPELRERRHYSTKAILGNAWVCAACEKFIRWESDK